MSTWGEALACIDDSNRWMTRQWGADPRLRGPRPSRARVRGVFRSPVGKVSRFARVDTNMIRASSRSAASHLHVVASEPATSPDDAPLIERAVELGVLAGAVRRWPTATAGSSCSKRPRAWARPRCSSARRCRRRQRLPRAPRRARARSSATSPSGSSARCWRRRCARPPAGARAAARRRRGGGGRAAARGHRPGRRLDHARSPTACCGCARRSPTAAAGTRRRRRAVGRPLVAGGARVPRAAHRRPAAADRGRRARRRPARRVGPAEPARRRAVGDRAAPAAADARRRRRS